MASQEQVLEQLKWVTSELRAARASVHAHEEAAREPIAVIGIGCRFPGGVTSPEDLWSLVVDGRDATSEVPASRGWDRLPWYHPDPDHEGTSYVRRGGFLDGADLFDNGFFGLAPREALAMDPQQRLLLETSWEAFERAGLDPADHAGTATGVFTGLVYNGYGAAHSTGGSDHAGHGLTGTSPAIAAGRVSYTFGFHGPAVSIDTMCSSSMVALHQACRSLRAGECHTALASGAIVIPDPTEFVEFSRQRALAPDGRCRPFSAAADGTAWGEGVGVLLLEPLSRAQELGHPVWAVVRGSAINQDGRSNGLTAPNGAAQRAVIESALAQAQVRPDEVDLIEAHGTGTRLGDPIEVHALQETYGRARTDGPLRIGSLKSNIGHTQAASGIAGVIKTISALRHGWMPRSLHVDELSAEVDWDTGGVAVLTEDRPWPERAGPRRAAVSSFGGSGTNAHVVLEQAPAVPEPSEPTDPDDGPAVRCWPLSALDPAALRGQAERLARALPELLDEAPVGDVAAALAHRHEFPSRAAVVGTGDELPGALAGIAAGTPGPAVVNGTALDTVRTVFVFPGQGAQWAGMAAQLLDRASAFTTALAECEKALAAHVPWSLRAVLLEEPGAPGLDSVDVVQPVLWAVNVALAAEWRDHGLEPSAVIGHSQGEVAAAVVAGAMTVDDGARIVARRSRLIGERLSGLGAMASLRMAEPERDALLAGEPEVEIAAHTSPTSVVVSGARAAVERVVAAAPDRARLIEVDYASHSRDVELLRDDLHAAVGDVSARSTEVAVYSTVAGRRIEPDELDTAYWWSNLRDPVRFEQAVRCAVEDGSTLFVEVSPHPVLGAAIEEILETTDTAGAALETLRRGAGDEVALSRAVATAWVHGAPVRLGESVPARRLVGRLPTYAFRRSSYWIAPSTRTGSAPSSDPLRLDERWRPMDRDGAGKPEYAAPAPALVLVPGSDEGGADSDGGETATVTDGLAGVLAVDRTVVVPIGGSDRDTADALTEVLDGHDGPVLSLLGLAERSDLGTRATVALLRIAATRDTTGLWLASRSAVRAEEHDIPDADQAVLWGLGRVAALEHPGLVAGLVDLPEEGGFDGLGEVVGSAPSRGEDEIALRAGVPWVRRIVPAPLAPPWSPPAGMVVTGATGALGSEAAYRLAVQGVQRLVLPTRRPVDDARVQEVCARIRGLGADPVPVTCDLRDGDAVSDLAHRHRDEVGEVVHAAVRTVVAPLTEVDPDVLADVVDLALGGTRNLTAAFGADVAVTTFASISGFWGAADHASMAAPGPPLAALAEQGRAAGRESTALFWGVWGVMPPESGSATDPESRSGEALPDPTALPTRQGLPPLDPAAATGAWTRARADATVTALVDVDWERFLAVYGMRRSTRRFAELPEAEAQGADTEPDPSGDDAARLRERLAAVPAAEHPTVLLETVRELCADVLGHHDASAVPERSPLQALGFDSLMSIDLRNRLQAAAGTPLRATLVFDFPTPQALAEHLGEAVGGAETEATEALPLVDVVARVETALGEAQTDDTEMPSLVRRLDDAIAAWRRARPSSSMPTPAESMPEHGDDEALLSFIRDQFGAPGG